VRALDELRLATRYPVDFAVAASDDVITRFAASPAPPRR